MRCVPQNSLIGLLFIIFFATMEKISVFFSKGHRHFYVFLHGVRVFELDRVRLRERDDGRHFRRRKEGQDRSLAQHHSLRKLQHAVCIRPTKTCATATTKCTKQSGNTVFLSQNWSVFVESLSCTFNFYLF